METVQSQLSDKEAQEAHFTEERQKLMETLEATKGMLEDLQEELESHDSELQQKLQDVNSKLEQEKVANRSLSQELQSQRDKSNSLTKQLQVNQSNTSILVIVFVYLQEATKDKTTVNDIKNKLEVCSSVYCVVSLHLLCVNVCHIMMLHSTLFCPEQAFLYVVISTS